MITKEIRQPVVAGMFYENDPVILKKEIASYFKQAGLPEVKEKIYGLVSPHAGYFYSGKTAAYSYKNLFGKSYDTVVIVSPSHQEYFKGLSVYNGAAYKTPLGIIEIDNDLREKISEDQDSIFISTSGHKAEHALEVQLPFLQTVLRDFKLLPIVMGDQNEEFVLTLAKVLAEILIDKNILLVASSDLSHYHSHKTADQLDSIVEKQINDFDYNGLLKSLTTNKVEACGGGPIVAVMLASKLLGATKSKVLYRCDSGEQSHDFNKVVGYLSAVFYG